MPTNSLNTSERLQAVAALFEGSSTKAICRITSVAEHTVLKLFKVFGRAGIDYSLAYSALA
jgi:transposase